MGDVFGVGKIVGDTVSTAGNLASQIYVADKNLQMARETNKQNMEIADANNQIAIALAREANQQNQDQFLSAQRFNAEQAELAHQRQVDMQEMMNRYNSPVEQLKRYRDAGLNPSLAFGGSAGMSSAVGSSSSASSPSGLPSVIPSLQTPHLDAPELNFSTGLADGLVKIAQSLESFKRAGKTDVEIKQMQDRFLREIDGMDLDNESKKIANTISQNFGGKLSDANVKSLLSSAAASAKLANLYALQGDTEKSNKAFVDAKSAVEKAQKGLLDSQKQLNDKELEWFDVQRKDALKTAIAQRISLNASAEQSKTQARVNESNAERQESLNDINRYLDDRNLRRDVFESDLRKQLEQNKVDKATAAKLAEIAVETAKWDAKRGDMHDIYYYIDHAWQILGIATNKSIPQRARTNTTNNNSFYLSE